MRAAIQRLDATNWALLTGALLRIAAFPFAEDLWSDAPVRSDIAQAWARAPGLWWSYRQVLQFGPLPTHLEGILIWLGVPGIVGARIVPLIFGIAGIALIAALARRLGGPEAAALAAWALALSPLHIQASTTSASEAIFLSFALGAAIAVIAERPWLLALCTFGASTTRYDAWLWIPAIGALVLWKGKGNARSMLTAAALLLGPASIALANQLEVGRPLAPLQHISQDQAHLADLVIGHWGASIWRLANLLFWPAAVLVVLTPAFGLVTFRNIRTRPASKALAPLAMALIPPSIYAVRGLLTATFLPMLRLALPPAALLIAATTAPSRRALRWAVAIAAVFDFGAFALATFSNPVQSIAQRVTPVSRLPDDLRAGVAAVRQAQGVVTMDQSSTWEDIVIAHHAGRDRFALYAPAQPPDEIVSIRGAALDTTLRATGHWLGRDCFMRGEVDRIAVWMCH